jgi:hypothetical protein
MTMPEIVPRDFGRVPLRHRLLARIAVFAARLLATRPPTRIRRTLLRLRKGAAPATPEQARYARDAVMTVSLACAGREGCLPRSLATVLYCRLQGRWAAWCVGTRKVPPFGAHAWVEVAGEPVGEEYPAGYFQTFFTVR